MTYPIDSAMARTPGTGSWNGETMSSLKIALIAGIVVATVVGNLLISGLVTQRETGKTAVGLDFRGVWGPPQPLYSPILVVPSRATPASAHQYVKVAPPRLEVTANLVPQERRRGLFHATVYEA